MTRGTAYIILPDDTIKTSCEFNGDMYGSPKDSEASRRNGHYASMVAHLKRADDAKSFEREIRKFDRIEHSNYQAENNGYFKFYTWNSTQENDKDGTINLNRDYYDRFFSDYLFWKNVSGKPVQFRTQKSKGTPSKIITVPNGKIATFYFGEHIETI